MRPHCRLELKITASSALALTSFVLGACGPTPTPNDAQSQSATTLKAEPTGSATARSAPAAPPSTSTSSALPSAQPVAPAAPVPSHFPPAHLTPPFERTAQPDDGKWQALGMPGEKSHVTPPVFVRTLIHPHAASRFHSLDVVAIDLSRVALFHVPGTDDHDVERLPKTVQPGLVPADHQARLLAVFNGGFQAQHGYWGMMSAGQTLLAAKEIGCTVAVTGDTVRIASWSALAAQAASLRFFRQTPPCLLEGGEIHRQLLAKNDRMWGGKNWHERTRRRSAIGLDAEGKVLYFAVGTELEPLGLAQAMKMVGAVSAAELDINWNWTRFLLFGTAEGEQQLRVTSTLLEGMPHNSRSYVARAEARDFFYLTLEASPSQASPLQEGARP